MKPCDLPNGIHPCGYDRKRKPFREVVAHYRTCADPWCQARADAFREMATAIAQDVARQRRPKPHAIRKVYAGAHGPTCGVCRQPVTWRHGRLGHY